MDVRNWPMDQIMQLPDHCFGRRFVVSCCVEAQPDVPTWDISELGFPESMVLWELGFYMYRFGDITDNFRLAIGDQLPTTVAEMDRLEPLIHGLGLPGVEPRQIIVPAAPDVSITVMRMPFKTGGRRFVLEASTTGASAIVVQVMTVVSSIPTEVPDCLLSV